MLVRRQIEVSGIVQGVGFRPYIYRLATEIRLAGTIRNTSSGVTIEVQGPPSAVDDFISRLPKEAPPLARITDIVTAELPCNGDRDFRIIASHAEETVRTLISPDVATCDDCLREVFDQNNRRYRYPFTNCTNCGPRFTIVHDIPYDRPHTSMAVFKMCVACQAEYDNPLDRRFHAQPNACWECGPRLELWDNSGRKLDSGDPMAEVIDHLNAGRIVAIKGLGGFHLAADATDRAAVGLLRERKRRVGKPFAIMVPDLETAQRICEVSDTEAAALQSMQRPIVLMRKRMGIDLAGDVAPGNKYLGVFLPYTPLHHLLLSEGKFTALVMTSGNLSEEPIAIRNDEARARLGELADYFLIHNREILLRCDDSVVRVLAASPTRKAFDRKDRKDPAKDAEEEAFNRRGREGRGDFAENAEEKRFNHEGHEGHEGFTKDQEEKTFNRRGREGRGDFAKNAEADQASYVDIVQQLRRSRGFVPVPVFLREEIPSILSVGGELKNTVCLTKGRHAFLSQHVGDLENLESYKFFEEAMHHLEKVLEIRPEIIAYDLHPDYFSTKWALGKSGMPLVGVQHHHAHVASCMAENHLEGKVIGIALDGTGYGTDGKIWGGEVLIADYKSFERAAHFEYVPLPGGAVAIHEPWRMAISYLAHHFGRDFMKSKLPFLEGIERSKVDLVLRAIERKINSPLTSSCGRLFDAVAAIADIRQQVTYEAQAAIELEMAAGDSSIEEAYEMELVAQADCLIVSTRKMFEALVEDIAASRPKPDISRKFHNGLVNILTQIAEHLRKQTSLDRVCLSGGTFNNLYLTAGLIPRLRSAGFEVFTQNEVPAGDGGLSLGQAMVAAHRTNA